ncbi:MAG TPA: aldo/keto reductase [Candidatus Cybelea sp.]|jgi:diketogulonate reductase-like aldo/keto reductase|nr:aldo/keto reductase [Candidatus Cybelea sp.]
MQQKPFGATGVDLPAIGQGTWNMPQSGSARKEALRALRRGMDLGMTHLDTAEMYGAGAVEELLGDAIAGIARERLFITSKVLPENATYAGTLAAARRSIARLRCDYLDLYLLHWPGSHPLEQTMRALEELVDEGTVRFVGVSNFDTAEMLEAASYLRKVPLACNQVLYHLNERGIEHELTATAGEHNVAIVAYTPFGRGVFLRRPEQREALETIARKYDATPRQIALAFLTRERNVFAIPKAASVAHVEENAGASAISLDAQDVAAIERAFARGRAGPLATL